MSIIFQQVFFGCQLIFIRFQKISDGFLMDVNGVTMESRWIPKGVQWTPIDFPRISIDFHNMTMDSQLAVNRCQSFPMDSQCVPNGLAMDSHSTSNRFP